VEDKKTKQTMFLSNMSNSFSAAQYQNTISGALDHIESRVSAMFLVVVEEGRRADAEIFCVDEQIALTFDMPGTA
jgi:hypothetical protein